MASSVQSRISMILPPMGRGSLRAPHTLGCLSHAASFLARSVMSSPHAWGFVVAKQVDRGPSWCSPRLRGSVYHQ